MTDRLSLYNGALAVMGERKLDTLADNVPGRYKLDDIWDRDMIRTVLNHGQWKFAIRTAEISYSPSVSPAPFGYEFGFEQPSDMVRVTAVCTDGFLKNPHLHFRDEAGYWWSDLQTLYVGFVSDGASYGSDFSKWPEDFTRYVEHWLAVEAGPTIMGASYDLKEKKQEMKDLKKHAKAVDAMKSPPKFQPPNSWTRSRQQRRGDRGSRTQLIG